MLAPGPVQAGVLANCPVITSALKPSQTITAWGDLRAIEKHEKQNLNAIVGWTSSSKLGSQLVVSLGENLTLGSWGFPAFREIFKDFALPIVLVLLGIAYQVFEKKKADLRQEQDRKITQIAQTWNSMLPESYRLTTKYYLPVQASARAALQLLMIQQLENDKQNLTPLSDKDKRRTFFFMVLFERRMRHLLDKAGGFYFKNRVGEMLVIKCYESYRRLYYYGNDNTWRNLSRMLDCIDVNEKIASFSSKFDGNGDENIKDTLQAGWNDFLAWLGSENCKPAISYLSGFTTVLEYEMNRPYEYWYGQPEKLILDSATESTLKSAGQEIEKESPYPGFSEQVNQYLKLGKA